MDKARRHEIKMLKYKKRLKNRKIYDETKSNFYILRSTASPCSCYACSGEKYSRKVKHKVNLLGDE